MANIAPAFGKSSIGLGTPGNPSIGGAYVCLCRGYASVCMTIEDHMGCQKLGSKSNKASWTKQLINVLDFHEFEMIHGK